MDVTGDEHRVDQQGEGSAPSGGGGIPDPPAELGPAAAAAAYRRWAPEVAEVLARAADGVTTRPVGPSVPPGWLLERLPAHPPGDGDRDSGDGDPGGGDPGGGDGDRGGGDRGGGDRGGDPGGGDLAALLADVEELVLPATVGWQSPAFFGYFPANASWPAALADLVSAGLGQQGMVWATSPACTELEMRMLDWTAELSGLPEHFRHDHPGPGGGVIQDSASSGTLVALVAARERAGGRDELHRQVVYTSEEAHSSVVKGARVAGFRESHIRRLPVDDALALRVDALATAMDEDAAAGLVPAAVVATVGTTSTLAVDPVAQVCDVAARHGAWVHVDAAMAGGATICAEHRDLLDGVDRADSYLFNPHKWWGVTFDCTTMWVADRTAMVDALSISPAYLRNEASESGAVVDFRDWQVPLGRRFRSLKLWFVLRTFGPGAIRAMVRAHVASADWLAEQVRASGQWELAAPPRLGLVCLRHVEGSAATTAALERVNASGEALLTPTEVGGEAVIRVSVGAMATGHADVERLWSLLT